MTNCARCGLPLQGQAIETPMGWLHPQCASAAVGPPQAMQAAPAGPRLSQNSTLALVLGLLSPFCCGAFSGVPAIILGLLARKEIKASGGTVTGESRATMGILLGALGCLLMVVLLIVRGLSPSGFESPPRGPVTEVPQKPKRESSILGNIEVACTPATAVSLNCQVKSTGSGRVKGCWDNVIECGGTRHVAHTCSSLMAVGATESRAVRDFSPVLSPEETCQAGMVENLVIQ